MIYFIQSQSQKAIKIGRADDPGKRLRDLQMGCPDKLILLIAIPGDRQEEAILHRKFDHLSIRGEWFREAPELMDEIATHRLLLQAVPGTNPEGWPVPQHELLRFFREQKVNCPELCFLTSIAVRHAASVFACECEFDPGITEALIGTRKRSYQVMRWSNSSGAGYEFWKHQLWERPQWYATPEEACAAYVASYGEWIKNGGSSS